MDTRRKNERKRAGLLRWWILAAIGAVCAFGALQASDGRIPVYQSTTIDSAGFYYLTQDITTGAGIAITHDNVTLDLNGHWIKSTSDGISVLGNHTNIRVTNGSVSAEGVGVSITLKADGFGEVDQIRILSAAGYGIYVWGPSASNPAKAVVERNTIVSMTSGSGISLSYLNNALIRENVVSGVTKNTGDGVGLYLSSCANGLITENDISANGYHGIYLFASDGNQISRNTCSSSTNGNGIELSSSNNNSLTWNTASANSLYGIEFSLTSTGNLYAYNHSPGNGHGSINDGSTGTNIAGIGNMP